MSFDAILSRIANAESVSSDEFLPYLCLEKREHRANVNMLLANAYSQSGSESDLRQAKVFVQRAWLLSRFSPDLLPLYTEIHAALDDVAGIREAYKRVGMMMASQGKVSEALRYFDLWQYAYAQFRNVDKYEYDFDILECFDRLAESHRFSPKRRTGLFKDGKIRVAYLVRGITELGSVLVKINLLFARFHDRSRFVPMFFAPESEDEILASAAAQKHLRLFESYDCKLMMAPNRGATEERLLAVARMIHQDTPDILITSAALASFEHYFISSLRPAPVVIGLVQGPPPQFAPLNLDWGLAWSKHPLIDCPVSCSRVRLGGDLPERSNITPYARAELDIPAEALVVASAGRYVKFQEPAFWQAVIDLLHQFPQMYYLVMGTEEVQVPFLSSMLPQKIRPRIRFLNWRGDDYLRALCLVEVLIDTFPSGGGGTLLDALALGIPCVSFESNYMKMFDQTDWSLGEEFIKIPELLVPRGDFAQLKRVVSRLISEPEHRLDMAQRSQKYVLETRESATRSVKECEDLYVRILEQGLSGKASLDPREAEIEEKIRRGRSETAPGRFAWTAYQMKRVLHLGERMLDRIAERKG